MYDSCNEDARPNSRNLQGKGARTRTRTRVCVYPLANDIVALTNAKARLLEILPIEEGRKMSSILYRVIESNIFDVSHCRKTGSVLPRTRALNVLHKFARVNMDGGGTIILALGIVVRLKNAINPAPLLLLRHTR